LYARLPRLSRASQLASAESLGGGGARLSHRSTLAAHYAHRPHLAPVGQRSLPRPIGRHARFYRGELLRAQLGAMVAGPASALRQRLLPARRRIFGQRATWPLQPLLARWSIRTLPRPAPAGQAALHHRKWSARSR